MPCPLKMNMFNNGKKKVEIPPFASRKEAFIYIFSLRINEGEDPLVAAKKANDFASTYASNTGLPDNVEPEKVGIDKYLGYVEKITTFVNNNPKLIEYGVPALTFLAGLFTGKKVEQEVEEHQKINEPINFENVK